MPSRICFDVSVLATRIKAVIWMGLLFGCLAVMQHVVFTGSDCFRNHLDFYLLQKTFSIGGTAYNSLKTYDSGFF